MKPPKPLGILFFLFFAAAGLSCAEPAWKRVLSGEITAPPVAFADRVYVETSDRMITCLSESGTFLWSRPLPGKSTPFLSVTPSGIVIAVTSPGIITACNRDGSFLWQLRGAELPLFSPLPGRDGRLFLFYRDRVLCLTVTGGVKWSLPLDENPLPTVSETGDGDLLVPCSGGILARISPFGELLEKTGIEGDLRSVIPVPGGFAAGFADGTVRSYEVRNGQSKRGRADTEAVWMYRSGAGIAGLSAAGHSILVLDGDGRLVSLNDTDGSPLWNLSSGMKTGERASVLFDYGQFNTACSAGVHAVDASGQFLWKRELPSGLFLPVFSGSGKVYTATGDWVISAWQVEFRIKSGKITQKGATYGILNGKSFGYGIPEGPDGQSAAGFLETVSADIAQGSVGPDEVHYARKCAEILKQDSGAGPFGRTFSETERARAAALLGKLGSEEYRQVLLEEAEKVRDTTLATGILFGLAACGPDASGEVPDAVGSILANCNSADTAVRRAACDTLYAVIRYSGADTARKGTLLLARFLDDAIDAGVRDYARKTLENLLD